MVRMYPCSYARTFPACKSMGSDRLIIFVIAGGGEVVVPEPARWNLSGGFPAPAAAKDQYGPETEFYMIAVFHQMHCLVSPNKSPTRVTADDS
jgi:hypothetical protein